MTSIASNKELTRSSQEEAKEEELQQSLAIVSELAQERPVASIVSSKVPTELEAECGKFQEQLHCVLKGVMD